MPAATAVRSHLGSTIALSSGYDSEGTQRWLERHVFSTIFTANTASADISCRHALVTFCSNYKCKLASILSRDLEHPRLLAPNTSMHPYSLCAAVANAWAFI
eukprot:1156131-Pelagomonas_calceolata.AAC.2